MERSSEFELSAKPLIKRMGTKKMVWSLGKCLDKERCDDSACFFLKDWKKSVRFAYCRHDSHQNSLINFLYKKFFNISFRFSLLIFNHRNVYRIFNFTAIYWQDAIIHVSIRAFNRKKILQFFYSANILLVQSATHYNKILGRGREREK